MDELQELLQLDVYIGINGCSLKTDDNLAVMAAVPLDRLLIETDSPYLAPVPYRGKTNTPAFVPLVAQQLAVLRGVSAEDIGRQSTANFHRLFQQTQAQLAREITFNHS